jgi:probable F420-dependent oxidoreductase
MIVAAMGGPSYSVVQMHLGLAIFPTDETPGPAQIARLAEDRGFESLWLPEHTHIPASRETPYPGGGDLRREYTRIMDPFVCLGAAAAVTSTLRLGTGVTLVIQRDPIVTAKEVATLDTISGGRVLLGVGAGWNREEMRNHGTDPRTRMAVLRERVEAMKAIWTQDEASYAGEHVRFERIWSWPKPVQQPHPPVYVGGNGPTVFDRVLGFGDGWMPNPFADDDTFLARVGALRERAGRDVPVTLNAAPPDPARLERYAAAGIERVVFYLGQGDVGRVEARMDRVLAAAREAALA